MIRITAYLVLLQFSSFLLADSTFRLANHYGNHMVLQRGPKQATIRGYGQTNQRVFVSVAGRTSMTRVNSVNAWFVKLDAQPAGGPYVIHAWSIANDSKVDIYLKDVYFGDIWFCSGQSNMGMTVSMTFNGQAEIHNSTSYNLIRLVQVNKYISNKPITDISNKNLRLKWVLPSPATIGGPAWTYYSAVCYMFGRRLHDVSKVPIGLVDAAYGGSTIEAWTRKEVLKTCNVTTPIRPDKPMDTLAGLWNAMISPFLTMTIKGVLWFQGESNCLRPTNYDCMFSSMINDWRLMWYTGTKGSTNRNFPFGFVQLGPFGNSSLYPSTMPVHLYEQNIPSIRWQQTGNYGYVPNKLLPNTFMATAYDLVDQTSPYHPIHFRDKTTVATRLLSGALNLAYQQKDVYWTGPIVDRVEISRAPNVYRTYICHVIFKTESIGKSLLEIRNVNGFEIIFTNKYTKKLTNWTPYSIQSYTSSSVTLRVWKFDEFDFTAIRYNWKQQPCSYKQCAIYSDGFPALPFFKLGPFNIS